MPSMTTAKLAYCYLDSPVGALLAARDGAVLRYLSFSTGKRPRQPDDAWVADASGFEAVAAQLDAYFHGDLEVFDITFHLAGTDFQKSVWQALTQIPFGQTISYGELARRVGNPKASRAVGMANNANPIPIIIPCHRVIGANRSLTGFGGGLETKEFLLKHEGVLADQPRLL